MTGSQLSYVLSLKKTMSWIKRNTDWSLFLVLLDKLFGKCLNRHLTGHFSVILSPFLSTYRKDYNCEVVLLRLIEDWRIVLRKTPWELFQWIWARYLILFHTISCSQNYQHNESLTLLQSYLQDTSQRLKIENITSDSVSVTRGVGSAII